MRYILPIQVGSSPRIVRKRRSWETGLTYSDAMYLLNKRIVILQELRALTEIELFAQHLPYLPLDIQRYIGKMLAVPLSSYLDSDKNVITPAVPLAIGIEEEDEEGDVIEPIPIPIANPPLPVDRHEHIEEEGDVDIYGYDEEEYEHEESENSYSSDEEEHTEKILYEQRLIDEWIEEGVFMNYPDTSEDEEDEEEIEE